MVSCDTRCDATARVVPCKGEGYIATGRQSPGDSMTIHRRSDSVPVQALPGITRRTLVHGPQMLTCEFTLQQGHDLPIHTHPHEQTGYVVSGRIRLHIDSQSFELGPGDSYYASPNVP